MASRTVTRHLLRRPLRPVFTTQRLAILQQQRHATSSTDPDVVDPNMNGGYVNPPRIKRSLRDPYADWWDKQERRNFGEPLHEDNDILGVFSTEEYTHYKPRTAFLFLGIFIAAIGGLTGLVYLTYPDRPSVPREFPDGLEAELGGSYAVRARKEGDPLE